MFRKIERYVLKNIEKHSNRKGRKERINKEVFCSEPFKNFEIDNKGNVFVCCPGWLPKSIGNLTKNTLSEVWNSKSAQAIRRTILNGSYEYCNENHCPLLKNNELPAFQEIKDPFYQEIIEKKITLLEKGPQLLNLGYDNTCNLRCRSCRDEFIVFKGKKFEKAQLIQNKILNSNLQDARLIVVTGHGDPFASKLYSQFLQQYEVEKYPKLKIRLFTNGLLLTSARWASLHRIHNAIEEIYVSVDAATKETYKILRRGGDFNRLLKNLEFIGSLKKDNIIKIFRISFVVQRENFKGMKMFVELGRKLNCNIIYFSQIRNWGTYSRKEFSETAVHKKSHPEHEALLEIIKDPIFNDPAVMLNVLASLRP